MKKNLTILLAIIVLMVSGSQYSYAAFPLSANKTESSLSTTTVDKGQPAIKSDESSAKSPSPAEGHHGGGNNKSWIAAVLLSLFLGGLGIHRFYLGYTWQGVVQLLTLGGFGIWSFIDFIRILMKDLKPNGGNYDK